MITKKLKNLLITILAASFCTGILQFGEVAWAEDPTEGLNICTLNLGNIETLTKEALETKAKEMSIKGLEDCSNKLDKLFKDTSVKLTQKENDVIIIIAIPTIANLINAKKTTAPIEEYIQSSAVNVSDLFAEENNCIKKNDEANITTIIEEPIESELTSTQTDKNHKTIVKICTRNTFCVKRSSTSTKELECVTKLTSKDDGKSAFCSPQAAEYVKNNPKESSLYCQPVQVFMAKSGIDMLYVYIGTIYKWAASVIGIIAVLIIVASGIQISAAAGDQQSVTNAKNRIFQSIVGIIVLFLSSIILYTINPNFFVS